MENKEEILKQIISNIEYLKTKQINEENTRSILIEPVLLLLGWNIYDINEVEREYNTSGRGFVDYKLKRDGKEFYLEVKPLGTDLSKHTIQITTYSYNDNIPFCILTDGNEYRFFETYKFEKKCIFTLKLDDFNLSLHEKIEIFNSLFIKNTDKGENRYNNHLYDEIKCNLSKLANKYKIKLTNKIKPQQEFIDKFIDYCYKAKICKDNKDKFEVNNIIYPSWLVSLSSQKIKKDYVPEGDFSGKKYWLTPLTQQKRTGDYFFTQENLSGFIKFSRQVNLDLKSLANKVIDGLKGKMKRLIIYGNATISGVSIKVIRIKKEFFKKIKSSEKQEKNVYY